MQVIHEMFYSHDKNASGINTVVKAIPVWHREQTCNNESSPMAGFHTLRSVFFGFISSLNIFFSLSFPLASNSINTNILDLWSEQSWLMYVNVIVGRIDALLSRLNEWFQLWRLVTGVVRAFNSHVVWWLWCHQVSFPNWTALTVFRCGA